MATVTFTYTFDVDDEIAAQMQADHLAGVYGHSELGRFVSARRLPAVYSTDRHRIGFEFGDAADEIDAPLILCGEFMDPSLTPPF